MEDQDPDLDAPISGGDPEFSVDHIRVSLDNVFSPLSPIDRASLFAGRKEQRRDLQRAITQKGGHAVLYGERGVGKTSLSNIIIEQYRGTNDTLAVRVGCDSGDTFSSIWSKVFREIKLISTKRRVGFMAESDKHVRSLSEDLRGEITPNDVRVVLESLNANTVCVLDEFDRVGRDQTPLIADVIKMCSDYAVPATIILVGVAGSVGALLREHASVERALTQVPMPRMSSDELREIVIFGFSKVGMTIDEECLGHITKLSNGLPHYTHLLAQNAGHEAIDCGRTSVMGDDIDKAINRAVLKSTESIKSAYATATRSPRPEHLYAHVLLACALAKLDQRGYFLAASVREALAVVKGKRIEIPAFSQHLNDFCDIKRGPILEKEGPKRSVRFRFINPLMQPYVVMSGIANGLTSRAQLDEFHGDAFAPK